tara:strand:- start:471 stop:992 length:522 start_codon:yes stop_codon:yes gene_type:complete
MIGFGQTKNYSSNDFSFIYPSSFDEKKLNLSHVLPTVKLVSKSQTHFDIVIIKKLSNTIPNNVTTSDVEEINNVELEKHILMLKENLGVESFGSFFSTTKEQIFNKIVFISIGKYEAADINLFTWKANYHFNVKNESFLIQYDSERIDGRENDSFDVFKNRLKEIFIIIESIK